MTDHLVAFEYGTGHVWGYVTARSASDIASTMPEVDVYERPPGWMPEGEVRRLRERSVYLGDGALDAILNPRPPVP